MSQYLLLWHATGNDVVGTSVVSVVVDDWELMSGAVVASSSSVLEPLWSLASVSGKSVPKFAVGLVIPVSDSLVWLGWMTVDIGL